MDSQQDRRGDQDATGGFHAIFVNEGQTRVNATRISNRCILTLPPPTSAEMAAPISGSARTGIDRRPRGTGVPRSIGSGQLEHVSRDDPLRGFFRHRPAQTQKRLLGQIQSSAAPMQDAPERLKNVVENRKIPAEIPSPGKGRAQEMRRALENFAA